MAKTTPGSEGTKVQRSKSETRLIMIRIVLLSFILFFNSTSTTYLYSFLPDMMVNFKLVATTTESGKWAAWMASGFFFGRFASASLWGIFIDKYGRKTGLLLVLSSVSVLTILFGLSSNYYFALFVRIITGFCNGLSIIGKTLSTEICPDDLKSWSISVTNTIWALGMTIGPFIGSHFYMKIEAFPYLASALAVASLGAILFVLSYKYFDETLPNPSQIAVPAPIALPDKGFQKLDESEDRADSEDVTVEVPTRAKAFSEMTKKEQLNYILNIPNISKLIFIFGINTFYAAVIGELIPFWVAAKYEDGGLDFNYKDISHIYLYLTVPQLVLQVFLYPVIQKGRGDFWLLSVGHLAHIPMFFFIPYAHWFGEAAITPQKVWIIFWLFIRNMASFMNFSSLQRFTNDAISGDKRGKLNGFQVTFSSCLQVAGPILGGWLLSMSMEKNYIYPFNYHFVFLLMVAVTIGVISVIYKLKFIDNEKKKLMGESSQGNWVK